MSSFGASFAIGSAPSARSVRDALASYRRVQYLVAGSTVATGSEASDLENEEEGSYQGLILESEGEENMDDVDVPRRRRDDSFVGQFDWDDEGDTSPDLGVVVQTGSPSSPISQPAYIRPVRSAGPSKPKRVHVNEITPLIKAPRDRLYSVSRQSHQDPHIQTPYDATLLAPSSTQLRRPSTVSHHSAKNDFQFALRGRSTYGQTLFNSIAILLGIGMLSEPLAFAYSGWIAGTILIISYAYVSCYTAKILSKLILSDPRLRSYSDIGRKAFGPRITIFISIMFCLELFAVTVILVTLYADSLHAIIPYYSSNAYKLWGLVILIPTVFLPLSLLSYTSILGVLSTIILVIVIFIDGFSKKESPGSLWSPAPTDFGVKDFNKLGIAFGLFMAGFSGHAVIPSLARDMADPSEFDTMINKAFGVATCVYTAIGCAGYFMFGNNVSDEISINLLNTPGYSTALNQVCLWLLVVSPLSKFALNTQPLNTTIEILLGIEASGISSPEDLVDKPNGLAISPQGSHIMLKRILAILQRVAVTVLSALVSIMVPEFSSMMAFLGSFSAFMLSIVGPILAKVTLDGYCGIFDGTIIVVGVGMAFWGTLAAFWSA